MRESIVNQNKVVQDEGTGVPRVVVVGVGGCGCRAVQVMAERGIAYAHFACADTDFHELRRNPAETCLPLGEKLAGGLGASGDPSIGREAAMESAKNLGEAFKDAELAIVVCGLGGGTGTGAAPVVARAAREAGALVVAIVAMPFEFEGAERAGIARDGLAELAREADCVIPLPNDRLLASASRDTSVKELMRKALDGIFFCARDISSLETAPGYIGLDPADVRTCMAGTGLGAMGVGAGRGRMRARKAVQNALAGIQQNGAILASTQSMAYVMIGPEDFGGEEMEEIGEIIRAPLSNKANVIFQVVFDSSLEDEIRVTVIIPGAGQQELQTRRTNMADVTLVYAGESHPLNYRILSALAESLPEDESCEWLGKILVGLGIPSISEKLADRSFVTREQRDALWEQGSLDVRRVLAGDWRFMAGLTDGQAEDLVSDNAPEALELAAGNAGELRSAVRDGRLGAEARDALLRHLHVHPNPLVRLGLAGRGRIPACFQPSFSDCIRNGFVSRAMERMARKDLPLLKDAPASALAEMAERIDLVEEPALREEMGMALARHPDPAVRLALAENCEAPAGALRLLLGDAEPDVAGTARQSLARQNQNVHRPRRRRHRRKEQDPDPIVMEQDSLDE